MGGFNTREKQGVFSEMVWMHAHEIMIELRFEPITNNGSVINFKDSLDF